MARSRATTSGKTAGSRRRTGGTRAAEMAMAALAHDIRTPLTGILALAELLAASELGERERRWVADLKSNAEHLAALTTLVVDAAKSGRRRLVLRRERFDPRALARAVAGSLAVRAEAAGLQSNVDLAARLPAFVAGDAVRLRAALENLIDNAVKFTESGQVGLAVSARPLARGRHRLEFAVTDSGIGLKPAEIKRLFRPFSQANRDIGRRYGGAGLGLSLVKRLAQAMGGDLSVTSAPGRGSTFRLSVVAAAAKPPTASAARSRSRGGRGRPRALRILYAEDNPYGRVVMNTVLGGLGHRADFVGGGEAAVEAVGRGGYDLVLMDVALAGIDGLEATKQIRALRGPARHIPIIGVSGHADARDEAAARRAGMSGYLVKPVSPRALAEAIAEVTRR